MSRVGRCSNEKASKIAAKLDEKASSQQYVVSFLMLLIKFRERMMIDYLIK